MSFKKIAITTAFTLIANYSIAEPTDNILDRLEGAVTENAEKVLKETISKEYVKEKVIDPWIDYVKGDSPRPSLGFGDNEAFEYIPPAKNVPKNLMGGDFGKTVIPDKKGESEFTWQSSERVLNRLDSRKLLDKEYAKEAAKRYADGFLSDVLVGLTNSILNQAQTMAMYENPQAMAISQHSELKGKADAQLVSTELNAKKQIASADNAKLKMEARAEMESAANALAGGGAFDKDEVSPDNPLVFQTDFKGNKIGEGGRLKVISDGVEHAKQLFVSSTNSKDTGWIADAVGEYVIMGSGKERVLPSNIAVLYTRVQGFQQIYNNTIEEFVLKASETGVTQELAKEFDQFMSSSSISFTTRELSELSKRSKGDRRSHISGISTTLAYERMNRDVTEAKGFLSWIKTAPSIQYSISSEIVSSRIQDKIYSLEAMLKQVVAKEKESAQFGNDVVTSLNKEKVMQTDSILRALEGAAENRSAPSVKRRMY